MLKKILSKGFIWFSLVCGLISAVQADDFHTYNGFDNREAYFGVHDRIPEYYRPRTVNPLMAMLPEYSLTGPGYICEKHQAPPVYRLPLQWGRNTGYREADWFNNRIIDMRYHPTNFGGYDY